MKLRLRNGLPFASAFVSFRGQAIELKHVLVDTGSASTVLATDQVLSIGLQYEPADSVHRIRGVGGTEFVFSKPIECLSVGELHVDNFEVEIGLLDYGFEIDGIIGMDFLTQVGAVIDLAALNISPK